MSTVGLHTPTIARAVPPKANTGLGEAPACHQSVAPNQIRTTQANQGARDANGK